MSGASAAHGHLAPVRDVEAGLQALGPVLAGGESAHQMTVHGVDRHGNAAVSGPHALYAVRLAVVDDVEIAPAAVRLEHLMARGIHLERHRGQVAAPYGLEQVDCHLLEERNDVVLLDKAHLAVDLGKFRLSVGAQIFVAETFCDLEVTVHAGYHQELLERLRTLGQGVELAGVHARRHDKVARSLRRRADEDGRFDFEESLAVEEATHFEADAVTQLEVGAHTLAAQVEHPLIVAGTGIGPRLASGYHLVDGRREVGREIDGAEKRFAHDDATGQRRGQVKGKAIVGSVLVLDGATKGDMGIAVAPVRRETGAQAVDAFGDDEKVQVAATAYHRPRLGPPRVGVGEQEIGRETGIDRLTRRDFVPTVALAAHRQVVVAGKAHLRTVAAMPAVDAVDVTVAAPFAYLVATVPRIPRSHFLSPPRFSLQYELAYPTMLAMMKMSDIPVLSTDRKENHPIVFAGGPCTYNPEPVRDFVDAFLIGDGEDILKEVVDVFKTQKALNNDRNSILQALSEVDGVYVPAFYDGKTINKRIYNFSPVSAPRKHPVPFSTSIHDRAVVEIRRGCGRMCRFCQPGHVNLPIRERKAEDIISITKDLVKNTGYDEFSMLSLSSNDYTNIEPVLEELTCYFNDKKVSASLPSQRIDRFNIRLSNLVKDVRKTTITLAPEAGSQRLRDVINKNISKDQIVNTTLDCYKNGYDSIKYYFILGLPTETYEDIDEFIELLSGIKYRAKLLKKELNLNYDLKLTCTMSIFVPKPFTPFQWAGQDSLEEISQKIAYIKEKSRSLKGVKIKIHEKYISEIEAVITRGDASLCKYIKTLYENGCYLDSWDENFDKDKWYNIADECGISLSELSQKVFDIDEALPWDFINVGIKKEWFKQEYQKALNSAASVPCETKCSNCGICPSFKVSKNIDKPYEPVLKDKKVYSRDNIKKYRAKVTKKGYLKFLSHLDWQNTLVKGLFRSQLPVVFTEGFNPIPRISLGVALPIFMESETEFIDFELFESYDTNELKTVLNKSFDPMAQIINICEIDKNTLSLDHTTQWARYEISHLVEDVSNFQDLMYIKDKLTSEDEIFLKKKTKKGIDKLVNIKQSVKDVEINDNKLYVTLKTGQNTDIPSVRADDLMKIFYPEKKFSITRTAFYDEDFNLL